MRGRLSLVGTEVWLGPVALPTGSDHGAVYWYLGCGLSYRDVEELLVGRGIEVDPLEAVVRGTQHVHDPLIFALITEPSCPSARGAPAPVVLPWQHWAGFTWASQAFACKAPHRCPDTPSSTSLVAGERCGS